MSSDVYTMEVVSDVEMERLLTPVSTTYRIPSRDVEPALVKVSKPKAVAKPSFQASTPAEALEILKHEPDYDALIATLRYLRQCDGNFSITSPSPIAAQLVHVLVSETVPNFWSVLSESMKDKGSKRKSGESNSSSDLELLLSCLRSVSGLSAILLGLKQRIQQSKDTKKAVGGPGIQDILSILLQVLEALLERADTVEKIWKSIHRSSDAAPKQKAIWQEFLNLAGGKLLGLCAEAEDIINDLSKNIGAKHWVADGSLYSLWLGRSISYWAKSLPANDGIAFKDCGSLLSKSFRLGHTESIIRELLNSMVLSKIEHHTNFTKLIEALPSFEVRNVIYSFLKLISHDYLPSNITTEDNSQWWKSDAPSVSAAAALIKLVMAGGEVQKSCLISWLTSSTGAGIGDGIAIRRAVLASLAVDKTDSEIVLEKSLQQFGDQLYIRHTPTLQQEVHAQILLLSAGYVHRTAPLRLAMMMRSGAHLSVVSNRLATSSPRARFLGMAVGEALSSLVDKGDKKMDFKIDEMSTAEAKWYKSLVNVSDTIGSIESLRSIAVVEIPRMPQPKPKKASSRPRAALTGSRIVAIEEIETDKEEVSDDDGLAPYAKPDSDAEDSDEDATLVIRNKPTSPVYIRDLIAFLRDTENYDRQKLGLTTAAPLIRRKANFGTEVSAHAEELATLLVGLQDKYEIEDFQDMRLQGMIAILIALPLKMGQWFSKTLFDGDYSLSQRASILTTLGLGARELGGFGEEDAALSFTKELSSSSSSFPSKILPPAMHRIYASEPQKRSVLKPSPNPPKRLSNERNAISILSSNLSTSLLRPLATSIAEKATGPNILKIQNSRTFSTRMAVESRRSKPTTNNLAKIVADGFFFPLTGRFSLHFRASSSSTAVILQPYLLAHFVKTLGLLLHASGPNTLSLPQMTSEFFDLLLAVRTQALGDIVVMEGIIFSFLTILEINEDKRRLVETQGRQLLEMQEWVESVFSRLSAGDGASEEDTNIRMLAAGVLVRIRECVENYQALLMGDLASF